jgi:radical SAM superfamily enzyme YgiQ (UPF0313 family)
MKILLINAWEKGCADTNFLSPPIGLWRMKSFLDNRSGKHDVEVFDPNLHENPRAELDRLCAHEKFHVVGFSPLFFTLENDLSLMFYLSEKNPDALFIAGGQQASFDCNFLFEKTPVQIIVVGEGEKPMLEILRKVDQHGLGKVNKDLSVFLDVPGLYLRNLRGSTEDGKTGHLPAMTGKEFSDVTFLTDFKNIPVQAYWNLLEKKYTSEELANEEIRKKIYTIKPYTSSFCPFRCIFCSSTNFYKKASGCEQKIAALSAEDIYDYVRLLLRTQPLSRTILFKDDNFFVRGSGNNIKATLVKLKELKDEYPFLSFAAKARIDTFSKHPELLEMCRDAGFFFISYGVESFSKKELDYMSKGIDPSTSRWVLKRTRELGIHSVAYVILTTPVTEIADMFTTIDECIDLIKEGNTVKVFPHLIPIPGSLLAADKDIEDCIVRKKFSVPGYDFEIEKAVKVNPRDKQAREVINEYESRIDEEAGTWKRRLGDKVHFVSELSTLIKFRLLYEVAKEKQFIPQMHAQKKTDLIESLIFENVGKKVEAELMHQ